MSHQLVPKEIKVDPAIGFPARGATENTSVETAGSFQVSDWKGKVETGVHGIAHGS
jgi:hypothetical protein